MQGRKRGGRGLTHLPPGPGPVVRGLGERPLPTGSSCLPPGHSQRRGQPGAAGGGLREGTAAGRGEQEGGCAQCLGTDWPWEDGCRSSAGWRLWLGGSVWFKGSTGHRDLWTGPAGKRPAPPWTVLPPGGQAGWASPAGATLSCYSRLRAEQPAHPFHRCGLIWAPQPPAGNSGFHFTGEEREVREREACRSSWWRGVGGDPGLQGLALPLQPVMGGG